MPTDRVAVLASANLNTFGRIVTLTTLKSEEDTADPFRRAVESAVRSLRFTPAIVDSKRRPVWFSFSVLFETVDSDVEVSVYPYLLLDTGAPQSLFSAPQRVLAGRYPRYCRNAKSVWTRVLVTAKGIPSNPDVIGGSDRCQQSLGKLLLKATYIPAMLEGAFIDSNYFEVWYTD